MTDQNETPEQPGSYAGAISNTIADHSTAPRAFLERASEVVALGYPVFPCRRKAEGPHDAKSPLVKWKGAATKDLEQIAQWSTQWPDALVGVPTGEATGLFILDVDKDAEKGLNGFDTLKERGWGQPGTRAHRTRRGGAHFLFRLPPGLRLKSTAGVLGDGLDTRGEGGLIIWWPVEGLEVVRGDIWGDIPNWLSKHPALQPGATRMAAPAASGKSIAGGERNARLASVAGSLRRQGLGEETITAALLGVNERECDPPLEKAEVLGIAHSIASLYPAGDPSAVSLVASDGKPRPQTAVLIDLGRRHHLFHDSGMTPYAAVPAGGRTAVLRVDGSEYREALGREYFALSGGGANRNAIGDAVNTLASMAKYDGPEEPVFMRVADTAGGIAIDLCDDTGEAVIVTADGWSIAPAPVHFRRVGKPLPLPRPASADFSRLWRHVNVEEGDRSLVAAWLLAALRPRGPYPIILLVGEQGAGKSSTSRALKRLTDPSATLLRAPPKDTRDLLVAALNSRVLALDNLSGANADLSDALCRLSTGGSLAERRLYSNEEEVLIEVQRPVILNGIEDPATRPDLADRCIHLLLPQLRAARSEADIERGFQEDAPAIFAALLDALALAIRDHGSVRIGKLPRMADFALWAAAGLPALGFTAEGFMAAYRRNRAELMDMAIEASPVASALVAFMDGRERWEGSSADLLSQLALMGDGAITSPAWPRSSKGLLATLRRLAPALRAQGIDATHRKTELRNVVEVCRIGKNVPDVPEAPAARVSAGTSGGCTFQQAPEAPADTRVAGTSGASGASFANLHDDDEPCFICGEVTCGGGCRSDDWPLSPCEHCGEIGCDCAKPKNKPIGISTESPEDR